MNIFKIIENELVDYESKSVEISESVHRSAYKRIKRIAFFENQGGEDNKVDELGQYQYWLNPVKIYIDSTVKNLRIDTKNFLAFSIAPVQDFPAVFTINCALREYLFDTNRDSQLKEDVEAYVGWGNNLWRKLEDSHELCDLSNTFVINQTCRTIEDSTIIERHQLTQSQLREKEGIFKNIDEVIKNCGNKTFKVNRKTISETTSNPMYEIYVRNGEISERDLFEAQGVKDTDNKGSKDKFLLAKVVVAGINKSSKQDDSKYILFAEPFGKKKMTDFYKEAHLGNYHGTWLREGIYETFFDYIIAIREIDNSIQEGLNWASKVIFASSDNKTFQNIRTDIENGRMIQSKDLKQVDVRLQNLDQLINRRNNLIEEMDKVAHSFEVVQGANMPSGTSFALTKQLDDNAGKYFIEIRQKITIAYKHIYKEWELPRIIKDLKAQDIIRVTGDASMVDAFRKLAVDSWYNKNLAKIGPHTADMRDTIKAEKLAELTKFEPLIKNMKEIWEGVLKRIYITITGENMDLAENLSTITTLLQFEQDPIRRAYLLDRVYAIKNIPLPPAPNPALLQQATPTQGNQTTAVATP